MLHAICAGATQAKLLEIFAIFFQLTFFSLDLSPNLTTSGQK
jgi:hypothetical protein